MDNPKQFGSKLGSKLFDEFIANLELFSNKIPELVKTSHIKTLEKDTVSKVFLEITKDYSWKLFYYEDHTLILGDVGVIGSFLPEGKYMSLLFFKKNLKDVFLPISKNHLLVGSSALETHPPPTTTQINEAVSKLCRKYFISARNDMQTQMLADFIGGKSSIVSDEDVNRLEARIQAEWFGK